MKYQIDDYFINQLFSHPTFQYNLNKSHVRTIPPSQHRPISTQLNNLVQQICTILSDEFKNKIDSQCLTIYQSHLQMVKQVQRIKNSMSVMTPTKTSIGQPKNNSILSDVLDQSIDHPRMRRDNEEIISKIGNNSFMSSFIFQSEAKQLKQELQERINATIIHLSGDVAKFQSSVQQRLKNVQNSLTRKMQNIYKTMTSIFETINDLQTKFYEVKQNKDDIKDKIRKQDILESKPTVKLGQQRKVEMHSTNEREVIPKRRSFLGFIKY